MIIEVRRLARAALAIYLICLILVVWTPTDLDQGKLLGLFTVSGNMEKFLNFLLLMPLPPLVNLSEILIKRFVFISIGPVLSILIEVMQNLIPGRDPSVIDILFNASGYIFIACIFDNHNPRRR